MKGPHRHPNIHSCFSPRQTDEHIQANTGHRCLLTWKAAIVVCLRPHTHIDCRPSQNSMQNMQTPIPHWHTQFEADCWGVVGYINKRGKSGRADRITSSCPDYFPLCTKWNSVGTNLQPRTGTEGINQAFGTIKDIDFCSICPLLDSRASKPKLRSPMQSIFWESLSWAAGTTGKIGDKTLSALPVSNLLYLVLTLFARDRKKGSV